MCIRLLRERVVDLLFSSWGEDSSRIQRQVSSENHLFAIGPRGEGFFLVYGALDRRVFRKIVQEANARDLPPPYRIYAKIALYTGPNVDFHNIPVHILRATKTKKHEYQ